MKNLLPWTAAALSCALFFGAGFFTGRLLPAHRYERLSETMLFDATTGKACMVKRVIGYEQATPSILEAPHAPGALPTTQFSSGVNEVDANPFVPSCGQ